MPTTELHVTPMMPIAILGCAILKFHLSLYDLANIHTFSQFLFDRIPMYFFEQTCKKISMVPKTWLATLWAVAYKISEMYQIEMSQPIKGRLSLNIILVSTYVFMLKKRKQE